jgi:enterochelin esterase-like enzyme
MIKHLFAAAALAALAIPAAAQNITAPDALVPAGITVQAVMVHGTSLAGNLEGNSADREVMVVLPPSYASNPTRRYPVIYYLHGFAISGRDFYDYMQVPTAVADNAAQGREFIVVVPDTLTAMGGSMYSNSATSSPLIWCAISMPISAPLPRAKGAGWRAIRWADTAPGWSA